MNQASDYPVQSEVNQASDYPVHLNRKSDFLVHIIFRLIHSRETYTIYRINGQQTILFYFRGKE